MRPTDSAMRWRRYRRGGSCPRAIPWRHVEGACGRGCAQVPKSSWGRGLSERSACPEQREGTLNQKPSAWESRFLAMLGMTTEHPPGATPGRPWFWVLLPKQKDLAVRGRNPADLPPRRAGAKPRKYSPPSPLSLNRKRDSETGRVGPEPGKEFHAPLGIHARSRGAHVGAGSS